MSDPHNVRTWQIKNTQYRIAKRDLPKIPKVVKRWRKMRKGDMLSYFPVEWSGYGHYPRSVKHAREMMEYYEIQRSTCPDQWCREAVNISDYCIHHQSKAYMVFSNYSVSEQEFRQNSALHITKTLNQMADSLANSENLHPLPPDTPVCQPPNSQDLVSAFPEPSPATPSSDPQPAAG